MTATSPSAAGYDAVRNPSWQERLADLQRIPICDLGRELSDELTRLLDVRNAVTEAARIERETGVNPLAVGCAGDD